MQSNVLIIAVKVVAKSWQIICLSPSRIILRVFSLFQYKFSSRIRNSTTEIELEEGQGLLDEENR